MNNIHYNIQLRIKININRLFLSDMEFACMLSTIQNEVIPSFLELISDSPKIQNWEAFFNRSLPNEYLGYESEEAYLSEKKLSIDDTIQNSIQQVFPRLESYETEALILSFKPLLDKCLIREQTNSGIPVYIEIVQLMEYIKQIKKITSALQSST